MTCPTDEELSAAAADALEALEAASLHEHVESCPECRGRFAVLRRDHAELVRTYEVLDRDHDRLREQLMASLPATVPQPAYAGGLGRGWRWLGDVAMRSPKVRWAAGVTVPAACILIAVWVLWNGQSSTAFGLAIERMQEMKTVTCQLASTINMAGSEYSVDGTLHMSDEHGVYYDMYMGGQPVGKYYHPVDGPAVTVNTMLKFYFQFEFREEDAEGFDPGRDPYALVTKLLSLTDDAARSLGIKTIDGREAEGFGIALAKLGLGLMESEGEDFGGAEQAEVSDGPRSAAHLWVDLETGLPVKFEIETAGAAPESRMTIVHEGFEWDPPLDPDLFKPVIPEGYTRADLEVPAAGEETLVEALRGSAELSGSYPSDLSMRGLGEFVGAAAAKHGAIGELDGPGMEELAQAVLEFGQAGQFYRKLVRDGWEPEYFGAEVEPGDAEAVLMRWRLDDGGMRVIYGDLTVENLEASD